MTRERRMFQAVSLAGFLLSVILALWVNACRKDQRLPDNK